MLAFDMTANLLDIIYYAKYNICQQWQYYVKEYAKWSVIMIIFAVVQMTSTLRLMREQLHVHIRAHPTLRWWWWWMSWNLLRVWRRTGTCIMSPDTRWGPLMCFWRLWWSDALRMLAKQLHIAYYMARSKITCFPNI